MLFRSERDLEIRDLKLQLAASRASAAAKVEDVEDGAKVEDNATSDAADQKSASEEVTPHVEESSSVKRADSELMSPDVKRT